MRSSASMYENLGFIFPLLVTETSRKNVLAVSKEIGNARQVLEQIKNKVNSGAENLMSLDSELDNLQIKISLVVSLDNSFSEKVVVLAQSIANYKVQSQNLSKNSSKSRQDYLTLAKALNEIVASVRAIISTYNPNANLDAVGPVIEDALSQEVCSELPPRESSVLSISDDAEPAPQSVSHMSGGELAQQLATHIHAIQTSEVDASNDLQRLKAALTTIAVLHDRLKHLSDSGKQLGLLKKLKIEASLFFLSKKIDDVKLSICISY